MKSPLTIASKILTHALGKCVLFIFIGTGLVYLVMGCNPMQPISSTSTVKEIKKDSSATNTEKKDSSTYKETLTEKTLKGAKVGISLTPEQFDSLVSVLKNLPSAVPQEVVYTDDKAKAQLTIAQDKYGKLYFECQSKDQVYHEKTIQQSRVIETLQEKYKAVESEKNALKEELKKERETFGQKLAAFMDKLYWIGIISVVLTAVFLVLTILGKFKRLTQ